MTQALFTAMTGLNAGTEQLTVVSDNVANMNTTAYKTSRVDFQDVWYSTKTTGTNSTRVSGGTNPYQIGVGVQCASISKDFGAASTNTTGRASDLAITGDGWFTILNADGKVMLTRDGTFSMDENGYLVTADGSKLLGMDQLESMQNSTTPIKMPISIKVTEDAPSTTKFEKYTSDDLNAIGTSYSGFTSGQFKLTVTQGTNQNTYTIDLSTNMDGDKIDISKLDMDTLKDLIDDKINATAAADLVEVSLGAGTFSFKADPGVTLTFENVDDAKKQTNFINATNLPNVTPIVDADGNNVYTSKVLARVATIGQVDDITSENTLNYESYSVGKDGLVTVTYSNGSILSIRANENGTTYFTYQDANGIIIDGDTTNSNDSPLYVDKNVLTKANMQLQLAKVVNNGGLIAEGNNQYSVGVNCGTVLYTAANINGVGAVASGALESSNVDLAQQFSNMILAQRLVQANSQVFSGANQMLETLVYLGQ